MLIETMSELPSIIVDKNQLRTMISMYPVFKLISKKMKEHIETN